MYCICDDIPREKFKKKVKSKEEKLPKLLWFGSCKKLQRLLRKLTKSVCCCYFDIFEEK